MYEQVNGNLIHKTALINWDYVEIGTGNTIYPYATIGFDAQHPREKSDGIVKIGNNNIIREYVSIHRPTNLNKVTIIGNDCYLMEGSHIGHDCIVEDNVRMSNKTMLSGNVYVMKNVVFGLAAVVHQSQVIGSYTMIGMGAVIDKNIKVLPGYTFVGVPAKLIKINSVGLERNRISQIDLQSETDRFFELREKKQ